MDLDPILSGRELCPFEALYLFRPSYMNELVLHLHKKKNKGSEDIGNYIMIYSGVPANQWASSGVAI